MSPDAPPRGTDTDSGVLRFGVAFGPTERVDRFLADQLAFSRTEAARLVAAGAVTVDSVPVRASRQLERGQEVCITFPEQGPPRTLAPHPIELVVVYEDEHLAVIDKPAGLVVHPAPGHWDDTLVNALVARGTTLSGGAAGRPGIVHRLDRDTSGLMVVAKDDLAHRRLGALLAARRIRRVYAALTWGHIDGDQVVEAPLARHPNDRKRMAVRPDGRSARTDVFPLARLGPLDLLRLELHTGRTHQIRVHLASIGHPVVGDQVYGMGGARRVSGPEARFARELEQLAPRHALHAAVLAFRHPIDGRALRFRAPWPADLLPLLTTAWAAETSPGQGDPLAVLGFDARDQ